MTVPGALRRLPIPTLIEHRVVLSMMVRWTIIAAMLRWLAPTVFQLVGGWYLPIIWFGSKIIWHVAAWEFDLRSRFGSFPSRAADEVTLYANFTRDIMVRASEYVTSLRWHSVECERQSQVVTRLELHAAVGADHLLEITPEMRQRISGISLPTFEELNLSHENCQEELDALSARVADAEQRIEERDERNKQWMERYFEDLSELFAIDALEAAGFDATEVKKNVTHYADSSSEPPHPTDDRDTFPLRATQEIGEVTCIECVRSLALAASPRD